MPPPFQPIIKPVSICKRECLHTVIPQPPDHPCDVFLYVIFREGVLKTNFITTGYNVNKVLIHL